MKKSTSTQMLINLAKSNHQKIKLIGKNQVELLDKIQFKLNLENFGEALPVRDVEQV